MFRKASNFLLRIILVSTIMFGNMCAYACQPIFFDLTHNGLEQLNQYKEYRKCKGFLQAYIYGLPVVSKGIVVDDYLKESNVIRIKNELGNLFMCRPDAPSKNWHLLPRGRNLDADHINGFLSECRKINPDVVLLCFYHPSLYFTGHVVKRYQISGAVNVVIDWNKSINIEYVGPGFDCGELTRGKNNSHTSVCVPWCVVQWPSVFIWYNVIINNMKQKSYDFSRNIRISELSRLGYSIDEVSTYVPSSPKLTNLQMFCKIYESCIRKIINFPQNFDYKTPVMIMMNLYEDKQHVFEIWASDQ